MRMAVQSSLYERAVERGESRPLLTPSSSVSMYYCPPPRTVTRHTHHPSLLFFFGNFSLVLLLCGAVYFVVVPLAGHLHLVQFLPARDWPSTRAESPTKQPSEEK
eukprot:RCo053007